MQKINKGDDVKYKVLILFDNFRFMTDRIFYGFITKLSRHCTIRMYGQEFYIRADYE